MNVNYDNVFKDIVKNIKGTPTVLLHSCCAPCSSQVLARLSDYFLVTVLYYNPNIEPFSEYEKRKEEQKRFIETFPSKNKISILDCDYENEKFKCIAKGLEDAPEGGERCHKCYNLRLEKTAILAKENGFDYFCTTLTVSPFKNSRILNEIGYLYPRYLSLTVSRAAIVFFSCHGRFNSFRQFCFNHLFHHFFFYACSFQLLS